jgi:hypothetical protein
MKTGAQAPFSWPEYDGEDKKSGNPKIAERNVFDAI